MRDKTALVERAARLLATDIPGTPRLLMRHRSPEELAAIQHGVESAFRKVQAPVRNTLHGVVNKVPVGDKVRGVLHRGTDLAVDNPEILPLQALPIPGVTPAYLAAKGGAHRIVDRFFPVADDTMKTVTSSALYAELAKLGTISDEQAAKSLDRYESLERSSPTVRQGLRYAAIGAVAGPAIRAVGQAIRGGRRSGVSMLGHLAGADLPGTGNALRSLASNAAGGAIGSGAIPLIRGQMDRQAEMGTLKQYLSERHQEPEHQAAGKLSDPFVPVEKSAAPVATKKKLQEKDSAMTGATPARPWDGSGGMYLNASFEKEARSGQVVTASEYEKNAFETSMYDSGMSPPRTNQVSQIPAFRVPSLRKPFEIPEKNASMAVTPMGRAHAAQRVGLPHSTAGTPSIAQVSKPVGYGRAIPGATSGKSGV